MEGPRVLESLLVGELPGQEHSHCTAPRVRNTLYFCKALKSWDYLLRQLSRLRQPMSSLSFPLLYLPYRVIMKINMKTQVKVF